MNKLRAQEEKWFVGYTLPKCEKKLHELLLRSEIESFLPLVKRRQRWSDRWKIVEFPLFPNYIFIKTNETMCWQLLGFRELKKFVRFDGKIAAMRTEDIESLKYLMDNGVYPDSGCDAHRLKRGTRVFIKNGLFSGLKGEILSKSGAKKLLIKIENVRQNLVLNLENSQLSDLFDLEVID